MLESYEVNKIALHIRIKVLKITIIKTQYTINYHNISDKNTKCAR